jgi:hypothetical protein
MKESVSGQPSVGPSSRTLGIRPGIDVPAVSPDEIVVPGQGGLSVSPDDPHNLPPTRRPPAFGGTGKDPVWGLDESDLGPDLRYRPDPDNDRHGFIEPVRAMPLREYEEAIARTQGLWKKEQVSP